MNEDERFSSKILGIFVCFTYIFIAFLVFLFIGICRVDASTNIDLINSWGGVNNSCTNCSYLNTSNFNGFGFQKTSFIFDEAYIDVSFSGVLSAQSNNAASLNISSYMVTLKGSTNSSNITNWCSISYHNDSRYEDHYSVGFDIHCTGQVHGNNWNLVIIDFYLNQRSTAGLVSAENFVVQAVTDSSAINSTINNSTNSIINNNNNNTDKVIDNQNKNTQDIIDSNKQTQDKLDDVNDSITDSNVDSSLDSASGFFNSFQDTDHGGLSGIITAPLVAINKMLSKECTPLTASYEGKDFSVPSGCDFWSRITEVQDFLNLVEGGLLCYLIIRQMFLLVQSLKDPEEDRVEVMSL